MRIQPALELNPAQANSPAKVDKVARQLEGQFAQMLVKSMRDASFGDSLMPGENQMFRDMYDQKIAESMTKGRGLGLSAMISRQLGGGDTEATKATDTRLNPADALRAYRLNAPAAAPMALPAANAPASAPSEVDLLQHLDGNAPSAVLQPMERALDLIAGRESSQMHEAIGRSDPYGALPGADTSSENWAMADDRWRDVGATAATTTGPSAVDTLAGSTAAAPTRRAHPRRLRGQHLGPCPAGRTRTGRGRQGAGRPGRAGNRLGPQAGPAQWRWQLATTCSGSRPAAGAVNAPPAAPTNMSTACAATKTASFRAYTSVGDSFADYVKLLKNSPRYQNALQAGGDVRGFAQGLQKAGYATDPSYAAKIAAIAGGPTIERAIAAVGDASQRLGRTFASTASPAGLGAIRR
jgi:flagellar protein FlgJ